MTNYIAGNQNLIPMRHLKIWFIVVGIIYLLLGIGFIPPLNALKIESMLPGFDAPIGGIAYRGLLDVTFMFGLDLIVIGGFLVYCSRQPQIHLNIVWLIILLELIRGIFDDVYMMAMGYEPAIYIGFIVLHAVIIFTGYQGMRKVKALQNA
jgi:hypothetical protein